LGDSPALSRRETDSLRGYIRGCQPKIYEKIRAVYKNVPDIE
jgi:hypothetical protein